VTDRFTYCPLKGDPISLLSRRAIAETSRGSKRQNVEEKRTERSTEDRQVVPGERESENMADESKD
jgi:hypothetical protein